jgi:hypothetical protein
MVTPAAIKTKTDSHARIRTPHSRGANFAEKRALIRAASGRTHGRGYATREATLTVTGAGLGM